MLLSALLTILPATPAPAAMGGDGGDDPVGDGIVVVALKTPDEAREPQIAIGSDGRVFVVYGAKGAVWCSSALGPSAPYGEAVKVGDAGKLSLGMRRGPRVAVAGDALVVTAIGGEKGGGQDGDVLGWRSTDGGASWSAAAKVNDAPGSAREGLHAMAAGRAGELFCLWIDLRDGKPSLRGAASTDGGASWGANRLVLGIGMGGGLCPCCHPSVAFDADGHVHAMWRGEKDDARDMLISESKDLGERFSTPVKLGQGTWKLRACPMDGGAVAAAKKPVTVWRRESRIYRAEATGAEKLLGEGEQPWIALGEDGIYVVWLARRGGALRLLRPGAKESIVLDRAANDPVIASAPDGTGPLVATWESGAGQAPRIVAARIDPAGTKPK